MRLKEFTTCIVFTDFLHWKCEQEFIKTSKTTEGNRRELILEVAEDHDHFKLICHKENDGVIAVVPRASDNSPDDV